MFLILSTNNTMYIYFTGMMMNEWTKVLKFYKIFETVLIDHTYLRIDKIINIYGIRRKYREIWRVLLKI